MQATQGQNVTQEIISEMYRTLVLFGAESDLLSTVGSWGNSLPDADVLANLKAWNQHTAEEIKARIEHYETSSLRPAYIPDADQQSDPSERRAS